MEYEEKIWDLDFYRDGKFLVSIGFRPMDRPPSPSSDPKVRRTKDIEFSEMKEPPPKDADRVVIRSRWIRPETWHLSGVKFEILEFVEDRGWCGLLSYDEIKYRNLNSVLSHDDDDDYCEAS